MQDLTEPALRTLFFGRYEATMAGATDVSPTHLVLGILREGKNVRECLSAIGLEPYAVRTALVDHQSVGPSSVPVNQDLPLDEATTRAVAQARDEARAAGSARVEPLHLLIGVLADPGSPVAARLGRLGLTAERVRAVAQDTASRVPAVAPGTTFIGVYRGQPGTSASRGLDRWEFAGFTLRALLADVHEISPRRIDLPPALDGATTYQLLSTPRAIVESTDGYQALATQVRSAIDTHFGMASTRTRRSTDVHVLTAPDGELRAHKESDSEGGGAGSMAFAVSETNLRFRDLPRAALRRLFEGPQSPPAAQIANMTSVSGLFSMSSLCNFLERSLGTVVIDETGLQGTYAIELRGETGTMVDHLRAIGLALTPASREIEFLVVTARRPV